MRVLLITDANSPHSQKWIDALVQAHIEVAVFSLRKPKSTIPGVSYFDSFNFNDNFFNKGLLSKFEYLRVVPALKKAILQFNPDILHAHYASSYGLLGALTGFHPYIISAWGSDAMNFSGRSFVRKLILRYNLSKADRILATSKALELQLKKITKKQVAIIPFGVDLNLFKPLKSGEHKSIISIGTIKSLEHIYGIDLLLRAFKLVLERNVSLLLKLVITGGGSREIEYKRLVEELGIADKVIFNGRVDHKLITSYHNDLDIFVNLSRSESFGVAVIEASACEVPVVVSDTGGLKEVVSENETGFKVPVEDFAAAADAIEKLVKDPALRKKMGKEGRKYVSENYNWNDNVNSLLDIYVDAIKPKITS